MVNNCLAFVVKLSGLKILHLVFKGFPREYYQNSKLMQKHGGELAGCGSVIRELRVVSQVSLLESRHPRSELYHESIF